LPKYGRIRLQYFGGVVIMKKYTLYLDESITGTFVSGTKTMINPHFCMAGIIVADNDVANLTTLLNNLKGTIWSDYSDPSSVILHQMKILEAQKGRLEVKKFPEYERFRKNAVSKRFYAELKKVFDLSSIEIVGCCISEEFLRKCYYVSNNEPDQYVIALQFILENYCHFLCSKNGCGGIIYESRELHGDERLRDKYYQIKLMGSMYMTKTTTEKRLLGLDFVSKSANNPCLQIADFVPHGFARHFAGMKQLKYNIFSTLQFHRYDGGAGNPDRYGIKYMP